MQAPKLCNPLLDVSDPGVEQVGDMAARRLTLVSNLQHLVEFAKGEPNRLTGTDETNPVDHGLVIVAVSQLGSVSLGYQASVFVEANSRRSQSDLAGYFTDLHGPKIPLDLQPYLKLYVQRMQVTLQYFDGCPNWNRTSAFLSTLVDEGLDFAVGYELIDTHQSAVARGFRGSPTVLIDGIDPFADKNAPIGLACRIYQTENGIAGSPSLSQLREALATTRKE